MSSGLPGCGMVSTLFDTEPMPLPIWSVLTPTLGHHEDDGADARGDRDVHDLVRADGLLEVQLHRRHPGVEVQVCGHGPDPAPDVARHPTGHRLPVLRVGAEPGEAGGGRQLAHPGGGGGTGRSATSRSRSAYVRACRARPDRSSSSEAVSRPSAYCCMSTWTSRSRSSWPTRRLPASVTSTWYESGLRTTSRCGSRYPGGRGRGWTGPERGHTLAVCVRHSFSFAAATRPRHSASLVASSWCLAEDQ